MKKSSIGYSIITVIVLLLTQIIIRSIGIENISVQIIIALFAIACSLAIFGTYKDGKKGFGLRYNTIVTILLVVASISISAMLIVIRAYPTLSYMYGKFLLILSMISYFALVLFIIIYRIVYEAKQR